MTKSRVKKLKGGYVEGDYVLYWMQASQREEFNLALEFAVQCANDQEKPLVVFFSLYPDFPEANTRHFSFMLQGLQQTARTIQGRQIRFACSTGDPREIVLSIAKRASCVVFDKGYTHLCRKWRRSILKAIDAMVFEIEDNVVIPVRDASHKEEYSAATLRRKIMNVLPAYLEETRTVKLETHSLDLDLQMEELSLDDLEGALERLRADNKVPASSCFNGGTDNAKKLLADFIEYKLPAYHDLRNDPCKEYQSSLSPYLHFGQVSPIFVAQQVLKHPGPGADAFIEELIVRRELSMNFVYYNQSYDSLDALPEWARSTLRDHAQDPRPYTYSLEELESSKTHDPYWNAAQTEMVITGKMHNYMRMYWGKKVIEWSPSVETAFDNLIYLNNKYELDGRDPNSYAGVLWCFGKHDRPWKERQIFGKIRYMNSSGLERKFDMKCYIERVSKLKQLSRDRPRRNNLIRE